MTPIPSPRYEAVRARFVSRFAPGIALIELCLADGAAGDWAGLAAFAHKLAGTAGSFGFAGLGEAALDLERAVQAAVPDEVAEAARALRGALLEVAGAV